MEKTEQTSKQEGEQPAEDEEDSARAKSLQLGGAGPNLGAISKYAGFLGEVRDELKKVSWPTRRTVVTETIVVIVITVFFTLMITGLDQLFSLGFNKLLFGK